jgi:hypothetical protein|tara:strand:+ start:2158 stop:2445 length:288 start_codon:yes stop_codon:yes gene_type:complete
MAIRVKLVTVKPDEKVFYDSTDSLKELHKEFIDSGKLFNTSAVYEGNTKTYIEDFVSEADRSEFLADPRKIEDGNFRRAYNESHGITLTITLTEV